MTNAKKQAIRRRLDKLKAYQEKDHLIIIRSWGDTISVDGQEIPRSEYERDRKHTGRVIYLTWD